MCATLCIILIEAEGDGLQIANAGHLPPVLRAPDGSTRFVREHGPMLGLGLPHPPSIRVTAPPGTLIVMVTDGLLERRGTDIADSLASLEEALAQAPGDPETVCDFLLTRFPPDGNDDVALLAVRLSESPP